jgi:hypothetical protein
MIILVVLAASIVLALMRGGNLGNLGTLNIRWRGFILIGFLIQVLIFSPFWQGKNETIALTRFAYLASLVLLLLALVTNHRIAGMRLIVFGFLLNFIAITLNGGYMPASPEALALSGLPQLSPGQVSSNSIGMGPNTQLFFLTDIFAIPKGFLLPNVFSIGDVLITIGAVYLIQKTLVVSPPQPRS